MQNQADDFPDDGRLLSGDDSLFSGNDGQVLPDEAAIEQWLRCESETSLSRLFTQANKIRSEQVGEAIHLRGLIEISNYCRRGCLYCGLASSNRKVTRYRLTTDEIMESVERAVSLGFSTVVLQGGEDLHFTRDIVEALITQIKDQFDIAITLSLGERSPEELKAWKQAGADRYLLRFETSDAAWLETIHPPLPHGPGRMELLRILRELGYEVGSGVMVGLPGQTYATLARDIMLFKELELDMIGIGPFIPHPETLLGRLGAQASPNQVPASVDMALKVIALARLVRPQANIPATTALSAIDSETGRLSALECGANVVMPNCTPSHYRSFYDIYPGKDCLTETEVALKILEAQIRSIGRTAGTDKGTSPAYRQRTSAE